MNRDTLDDIGRLLLRVLVGGLMLFHGVAKLRHGIAHVRHDLMTHGLPSFVAYGVYLGEVVAPVLIVLGLFTRVAAIVEAADMVFAVGLIHTGQLGQTSATGGYALELQAFYFFGALAIALLGAGRFAFGGAKGRFN